jgi:hypothetical protein
VKSWVVDTSNDGSNWTEIDRREKNGGVKGDGFVGTFSISISGQQSKGRFVHLR